MLFYILVVLGFAKYHFKQIKCRHCLEEFTQIHHVIPRQFRNHPCSRYIDIDCNKNLMLMPNKKGIDVINTTRPIHDGGHFAYNRYVGGRLDEILKESSLVAYSVRESYEQYKMDRLIQELRYRVRLNNIPWC